MQTIHHEHIDQLLADLHEKARIDSIKRTEDRRAGNLANNWDTAYLAVSAEEGMMLNFLVGLTRSKHIVEFGCSFGISTIYLAAAAKDNGGHVVTTDLETSKVQGANKNLTLAGLHDQVEILQGDAMLTLASIQSEIDFLFLDGAKELYLPVFEMLRPKLKKGAVIFADNTDKPTTKTYVDHILHSPDEFTAIWLFEKRALVAYIR